MPDIRAGLNYFWRGVGALLKEWLKYAKSGAQGRSQDFYCVGGLKPPRRRDQDAVGTEEV